MGTPDGVWRWSAVDLAAMTDAHHQDQQLAALPLVNHPVVAYPKPPQAFEFTLERRTGGRGVAEEVDGVNHPQPIGLGECGESLGG